MEATKTDQTGIEVQLTGEDGNVFNLIGIASRALRKGGFADAAKKMAAEVFACGSYDEALQIICEYVDAR